MTVRNLSPATQRSYLYAVTKFSRFFRRSADRMSVEDVCAVVRNNRHDSAYLDEPAALKVRSPPPQRAWMSFARICPACSSPSASITSARRGAPPGSHHRLVQVDVLQFNVRDLDIPTRLHHPTKRIRKATISENKAEQARLLHFFAGLGIARDGTQPRGENISKRQCHSEHGQQG